MIALDTDVLVRYPVHDDARQAETARSLLEAFTAEWPDFVCHEVTIEPGFCRREYRKAPSKSLSFKEFRQRTT